MLPLGILPLRVLTLTLRVLTLRVLTLSLCVLTLSILSTPLSVLRRPSTLHVLSTTLILPLRMLRRATLVLPLRALSRTDHRVRQRSRLWQRAYRATATATRSQATPWRSTPTRRPT